MTSQSFTTSFTVVRTPQQVFDAVNDVRSWWTGEIEGRADQLGSKFTYRYQDFHRSTHEVTELVPGEKIVWRTIDANLNFVEDETEWNGTEIMFEIARRGDETELRFTHVGLVPEFECYAGCSGAWGSLVNEGLRHLIVSGEAKRVGVE